MKNSTLLICLLLFITFFLGSCEDKSNPYGLNKEFPFMDYDSVMSNRPQNDKPVLIYFNSIGCVNCRRLEKEIIKDKETLKNLQEKYQFINLYVDDRTRLDSSRWFETRTGSGRYYKNKGAISGKVQFKITQTASQPTFCILDDSLNLRHLFFYGNREELYKKINESN
jgi:thioredoxin-related protein